MSVIEISRHPEGRRVRVLGRRTHHGLAGACLVSAGATLVTCGVVLMISDWHDRDHWFRDFVG